MRNSLICAWQDEEGVLSFEWVLLTTLVTVGVVGGLAAARDAIVDELGDAAQSMLALDQSYAIAFPLQVQVHTMSSSSASNSQFTDALIYSDCARSAGPAGQPIPNDDVGPP